MISAFQKPKVYQSSWHILYASQGTAVNVVELRTEKQAALIGDMKGAQYCSGRWMTAPNGKTLVSGKPKDTRRHRKDKSSFIPLGIVK
jgi:hypothetical protein